MVLTCSDHIQFFSSYAIRLLIFPNSHIVFFSFQFFRSITSDSAVLRDDYDVRDGNSADDFTLRRTFQDLRKNNIMMPGVYGTVTFTVHLTLDFGCGVVA